MVDLIKKRPCTFGVQKWIANDPSGEYDTPGEHVWIEGDGIFHRWADDIEADIKTGMSNITVGIVEDENGQCHTVNPNDIKFTDK